jgi:hypothetical protein
MTTAHDTDSLTPWRVIPGDPPRTSRRLLVITYHFPPSQTAGALRWQKLAGLAAERGWSADFVTLHPDQIEPRDERRLADLPPGTRIFGVRHKEHWIMAPAKAASRLKKRIFGERAAGSWAPPAATSTATGNGAAAEPVAIRREDLRWIPRSGADVLRAYRGWLYHSTEGTWMRAATRVALRLAARERYDAVVSCGPPHLMHETGRLVAAAQGIPHVMDMRDPWSILPDIDKRYASPIWFAVADRYEARAVRTASLVVMNTEPARDGMRARYPEAADRIIAVLNGWDVDPMPPSHHGDRFLIAYAGSIYMNRDPRLTFRAASRVIRELSLTPDQFKFAFLGHGGDYAERVAREEGVSEFVEVHAAMPRAKAMEFLAGAAMLLNLPQEIHLCVPSKVYEYLRFAAWILALERTGSATEMVLRDTGADVVDPDDVDGIAAVLRDRYLAYRAGARPEPPSRVEHLSRRAQGGLLFDAIERIAPRRA